MLSLLIESGELFYNTGGAFLPLCKAGAGNGRANIPTGRYEVGTQFSHVHGEVLPDAVGLGWLGANPGCDIILGGIRGRNGVVPSASSVAQVLAKMEVAEGSGQTVYLEVR